MKFVTFQVKTPIGAVNRVGILREGGITDVNAVYGRYLREVNKCHRWRELAHAIVSPDMLAFIQNGSLAIDAVRTSLRHFEEAGDSGTCKDDETFSYSADQVRILAPVTRPVSIRDCSAFLQHTVNLSRGRPMPEGFYEIPAHYRTSTTDVAGPDDPMIWPSYAEKLDYELEIAVCIGKEGVNISEEKAEEYIFGYTIFNDVSARDIQKREMDVRLGPAKTKCFRNSNIMGPCLVTPDELDVNNLRMTAQINGEVWSDGNTRDMHFKFPRLIAHLSQDDPIYPGEFIGSGTVSSGCGFELDRWIRPGDVVELEIEGIGTLRNKVVR